MQRFTVMMSVVLNLCLCGYSFAAQQVIVGLNDVIATVESAFKTGNNIEAPITDFTADFFQSTILRKENREMRGEGQVTVKLASSSSPLMYRFQYLRPYQQEIVSDGNSLWIYHPENREVILSDVSFIYNRPGFNPDRDPAVNFLQGLGRISRDFQINFAAGMYDSAGNYVLELNPRRSMLNTRRILLVVSRSRAVDYVNLKRPPVTGQPARPTASAPRSNIGVSDKFGPLPQVGGSSDPFPLLSTTVEDQDGNSTTMEFTNIRINSRLQQSYFSFEVPPGVQVVRPSELNQPR